ncbi:MAG: ATP-dependent DNA helicase RecG [Verrucomicrobia bacterium]|nr:ATP-dependent DNA helicase RecG [Verrucomicrobiota bacterium]
MPISASKFEPSAIVEMLTASDPASAAPLTLDQPLTDVPGLGAVRAKACARLEIFTVGDLLAHFPRRYEDRRQFENFPTQPGERPVCVCGVVVGTQTKRFGRGRTLFEATLQEPSGHALAARLVVRWFNLFYVQKTVAHGQRLVVYGKPKARGRDIVIDHPEFEILEGNPEAEEEERLVHLRRITPIYATTEGLSQRVLRRLIYQTLQRVELDKLDTPLPRTLDPWPRGVALQWIHFPADESELRAARQHLVLTEFFALQLVIAARRAQSTAQLGENHAGHGALLEKFLASLPFPLTAAQARAITEIRADLAAPRPMNRLLQGDVGAGKTLVALAAMLLCVEAGFQAALMAPTQILAEQHFLVFRRWLEPLGVRLALRTGARREETLGGDFAEFFQGAPPQIYVGTHALLFDKNPPPRLGLAVIDEQHKFGVLQRAALAQSGGQRAAPDVLVMTATPIPRTLAITVYGDLDVSVLDELPVGRGKVITGVRPESKLPDAAAFLRAQLDAGRQAYIVYPLVEESDKLGPATKAATARFEHWRTLLAPHRTALLHGRVPPDEKDAIMQQFRAGDIRALVATTVIEVGIDVKNASVMLIENAERFGLAQLHQLRGRIGRGEHKSYCVLITGEEATPEAMEKLRVLEETSDGFKIAEADLRLRGPGDLLGTAQSGLPPLKLGNLIDDAELMKTARAAAREIFARDPELAAAENQRFRRYLVESRKLLLAQVS